MAKRLGELKRRANRAHEALVGGEWWDGKRWRPRGKLPRTAAEGKAYRTAQDVLAELTQAMVGGGPVNGRARVLAVRRFDRRYEADRDERSASTPKEAEAEMIFEWARPYLRRKPHRNRVGFTDEAAQRTAWTALARYVSLERKQTITPNQLRMICRHRGEK